MTGRTWGLVLAAGIAAGVWSWLATEGVLKAYKPALWPPMKPMPTIDDARQFWLAQVASGTAAFGAMGGLLGLAFGLAGGASRRSVRAAGMAGTVGLLAGSAVVAGVAWAVLPIVYMRLDPQSHDLLIPLLYHEALWSIAGAAGWPGVRPRGRRAGPLEEDGDRGMGRGRPRDGRVRTGRGARVPDAPGPVPAPRLIGDASPGPCPGRSRGGDRDGRGGR